MAASLWLLSTLLRNDYCGWDVQGSNREIIMLQHQRNLFFLEVLAQTQKISFVRLWPLIELDVVQKAVVRVIFPLIPYCDSQTWCFCLFGIDGFLSIINSCIYFSVDIYLFVFQRGADPIDVPPWVLNWMILWLSHCPMSKSQLYSWAKWTYLWLHMDSHPSCIWEKCFPNMLQSYSNKPNGKSLPPKVRGSSLIQSLSTTGV